MSNERGETSGSVNMLEGSLYKKILLYAVPVMLTGILQLLFNAADLVVVGRFCGSVSVAAVGATGAIINLIVNLFIGLSVGAGVSVAQSLGAQDDEAVHRVIHTAIPTAMISGVVLTIVGVAGSHLFLSLMGTPDDVIDLSTVYMRIYFAGIIASLLYNYGAAILRAAGDTRRPLIYLTTAGVVNVVLNVCFVLLLDLDVAGVALATTISQCLSAGLVLRALMKRTDACRLQFSKFRIYGESLRRIVRIGLPAGIQGSMFSISNVIIQSSVNSFGSVVMAGNAAGSNIEGFVWISMNAFHHAGMNFVGQNYGAKRYDRIFKIRRICILYVTLTGLIMGVTCYLFAPQLLSIYITDSVDPIQYGVLRMTCICLPYFLNGLHDVMTGIIRGMGASTAPMAITVFGICVFRIIWIYTVFRMPKYHTLTVLYLSYPLSWILTFTMLCICYRVITSRWKKYPGLEQ